MVFKDLQGKKLTTEEILKKREEENGVFILTRNNWICRVHKGKTIVIRCSKCNFPVMEYTLKTHNGKALLYLGCPYCFATERITNKETIRLLLNREEENKETQPPLFNEVMVQ